MIGPTIILGWVNESWVDQAGQPGFNQNLSNQAQPSSFIQYVAWFLSFTGATDKLSIMYTIVFIPRKMFSCALQSNGSLSIVMSVIVEFSLSFGFFGCRLLCLEKYFYSFVILSFLMTPHILLRVHISVRCAFSFSCFFFAQTSAPYCIVLLENVTQ